MCNRFTCDRCGKNNDWPKESEDTYRLVIVVERINSYDYKLDLCPECYKALKNFMNCCEEKKDG